MLEECDRGDLVALIRRMRARGAPGSMTARNSPTVPAPAARSGLAGPCFRARLFLGNPHQQPDHALIPYRIRIQILPLHEGAPPGAARSVAPPPGDSHNRKAQRSAAETGPVYRRRNDHGLHTNP